METNRGFTGADLEVDERLRGTLALGVLEADGVTHAPLPKEFLDERDQVVTRWTSLYAGRAPADIPGVAEARALFHLLDIDPTKTRPSSEALLRRVLQGKGLPQVSPVVDVCNLCSLEQQFPLGLYDLDRIGGRPKARVGREGEGYEGIRKDRVNVAGRLTLADDHGPFGAPTSDSLRTSITSATSRVLVVVFCPRERAGAHLSTALEQIAERLGRYCRGRIVAVRTLQ
jgi:DNA/RNA-binding domain of Phe-tRNA-synthetase-like protein